MFFKYIRMLYNWVLTWAYSPYGPLALILISFTEAIIFPIPPDILLIALAISSRTKAFYYAFLCSISSILGGICGYYIGYYFWWDHGAYTQIAEFFFHYIPNFSKDAFIAIQDKYRKFDLMIIFTAGFTPLPYKIFSISAGINNISFPIFLLSTIISRSARFFLLSFLIFNYGEKIKDFIDYYFNLLTVIFILLFIGFYILLNNLIH